MNDPGPLGETELRVLRVIAGLVTQAGPVPHVGVPEIARKAGLAEPLALATLDHLSPQYVEVIEHLTGGSAAVEPMVRGLTTDAYELING